MPLFNASAVPADDFRVGYLEEARECLRASNRILKKYPEDWNAIPEFWANLLGGIANAALASVPNDVALGLFMRDEDRRKEAQNLRDFLDEKLGAK